MLRSPPVRHLSSRRMQAVSSIYIAVERKAKDMTYCIGVRLDQGMIFASDSRTNAGMDNFAKFCKMTVFERRGDRVIVLLSSGNLAGTQAVIGVLNRRCTSGDAAENLWTATTMFATFFRIRFDHLQLWLGSSRPQSTSSSGGPRWARRLTRPLAARSRPSAP